MGVTLIGGTWVPMGLEAVSWRRHNPTNHVNLPLVGSSRLEQWSRYFMSCNGAAMLPGKLLLRVIGLCRAHLNSMILSS
jgi:hypothetical protein